MQMVRRARHGHLRLRGELRDSEPERVGQSAVRGVRADRCVHLRQRDVRGGVTAARSDAARSCSLDGYRDETTNVYRESAPAAAWDSPVFAVLDEMSGSAYRLQRKTLFVELTPITAHGPGKTNP